MTAVTPEVLCSNCPSVQHYDCLRNSFEQLSKRVDENKVACEHSKNNIKNNLNYFSDKVEDAFDRTNEQFSSIKSAIEKSDIRSEKLELKLIKAEEKNAEVFFEIKSKLAESSQTHRNNGYLIKWIMGICSGIFVSSTVAVIVFLLNK